MADIKQIKVGNTTYNIEPVTAYLPLYDLGNTTFKVTRGASQSTKNTGYWAGMLNSGQEGSPTLPSTGAWWHVISMDWTSVDSNNWISQLALPTQHGGVPHYRRNNTTDTSIDSSTWHAFITDENIGSQNVNYANSAGSVAWGNVSNKPFKGTNFVSGDSGNGEHNANNTIENGHYYYNSNGPATSLGASYIDGALYVQSHSNAWVGQIAQDYRNGSLFVRGKNNGSWSSWKRIIDSDNIGSQSVNYATSAGNADTLDGKHSSDFYLSSSNITNLPINGGIYWNSYVESSSDGSDAASITVIKDGNGSGGTVLQIKQANDANDIVNVVAGDLKLNGGSVSHLLRTYNAGNGSHGEDYYLKCRHNVDGNDRFKLQIVRTDGSVTHSTSVDYANSAGSANSVAWGNVSGKPSSFTPATHTHTSLKSNTDNRNSNTTPNDYNGVFNIAGLKGNDKIGIDTNTYGTYSCLIGVRGWQDSSGGDSHEIALTGNGQILHRSGSTTSWGGWDKIAHTSYIDTYFPRAKYGNDSYYSDVSNSFIGGVAAGPRTSGWEFLYRAEHRNGAGDGPNYVMEMVSDLTSDSSIYWRKKTGGSFTSFREIIDSNNIGSQNVNYANSAGSANSVAWGNVTDKPDLADMTYVDTQLGNVRNSISGLGSALNNKADKGHSHPVDSSLSSSSSNPVQNSAIYSAFSNAVGFDSNSYRYGDNGSWRLWQYNNTGNSLDIKYGKIAINAQEKTYSVSFTGNAFANNNYAVVCGIYRDNRNSWFWSPLVKSRSNTGFTVYVRGNTSGDNSGTLFYIAIRSN